uniref:putative B3 domain-containing protein REM15 n=1 Tax=Erigeron canadensis TaxID=72917 RepID=UPI001CB954EF|nr:putative B3 domain-containing protein REM15 [Erigeron canadensis]
MARRRPPPSLFWKTLLDPSSAELEIPSIASTTYFNNKVPKDDPITLSANGGYSWEVKVEKIGEGLWFTNGWRNVVQDAQFRPGDIVLFRIVDDHQSRIKMSVYSSHGLERSLPPNHRVEPDVFVFNGDDDDNKVIVSTLSEDEGDGDPFFVTVVSKSHNTMLRLPRDFVRLAKIEDKRTIMLKGIGGNEWRMGIGLDTGNATVRYFLSAGWLDFKRSNNLSKGDECVFKFLRSENKMCLEKVTKRPINQNPTTQPPKKNSGGDSVAAVAKLEATRKVT